MITFTIPGKPYAQKRPRVTKFGTFMPKENRDAEALIVMSLRQRYAGKQLKPTGRPLRLSLVCVFEPAKSWPMWKRDAALEGYIAHTQKPDGDNLAKTVKDALKGIVWDDDSQSVITCVEKLWGETPHTLVKIEPIAKLRHDCTKSDFLAATGTQIDALA